MVILSFIHHSDNLISLNLNLLDTNFLNIFFLIGLLFYLYKTSFTLTLENRQKEIFKSLENYQKEFLNSLKYYFLGEKTFFNQIFCLAESTKDFKKENLKFFEAKYKNVRETLLNIFLTSENLLYTFDKQSIISLQRYLVFITASKILRKFIFLSKDEQSKIIFLALKRLGEL